MRIYSTESQESFTNKEFLALAMAFNLLLSNLTAIAKAKKPLCQWNLQGYFFQLATKSCKLEPRPKVAKLFCQWLGVTGITSVMTPKSIMKLNFLLSFVIHSVLTKDFFCFWNGYLQHQSEDIFHFHFIIIVKAFYCILMPWIRTSKSTIPLSPIHSLLLRYMGIIESRRLNH